MGEEMRHVETSPKVIRDALIAEGALETFRSEGGTEFELAIGLICDFEICLGRHTHY